MLMLLATICKRYCVQGLKMHVHAMIDLGYLLWSICVYHILCTRRVFLSTNFHRPLGLSNDAALRRVIARTCSNTNRYRFFFFAYASDFFVKIIFCLLKKIYTLKCRFFLSIYPWPSFWLSICDFFRQSSSHVINTSNSFRSFGIDCLISPDFFVNKRLFFGFLVLLYLFLSLFLGILLNKMNVLLNRLWLNGFTLKSLRHTEYLERLRHFLNFFFYITALFCSSFITHANDQKWKIYGKLLFKGNS